MKIRLILVSTLLTVAFCLLTNSKAKAGPAETNTINTISNVDEHEKFCSKNPNATYCKRPDGFEKFISSISGNPSECSTAKKEFNAANAKNISSPGNLEIAVRCLTCSKSSSDRPNYCERTPALTSSSKRNRSSSRDLLGRGTKKKPGVSAKKIRSIQACPNVAEENIEKFSEAISNHEDKIESLTEKIDTTKQEIAESNNKVKAAKIKFDEDLKTLEKEKEADLENLKKAIAEESEAASRQFDLLSQKIKQLAGALANLNFQRDSGLRAIEKKCLEVARQSVREDKTSRLDKISKNTLSKKSIISLLDNTGKSQNEKNSSSGVQYYNQCMLLNNDQIINIRQDYKIRFEQIQSEILETREQQAKLIAALSDPQKRAEQLALFEKINTKYKEGYAKALSDYKTTVETEDEILNGPMQDRKLGLNGVGTSGGLNGKLARLEADIASERSSLEEKVEALEIAEASAAQNPGEGYLADFSALNAAARSMYEDCGCSDKGSSSVSENECKKAMVVFCNTDIWGDDFCTNKSGRKIDLMTKPGGSDK